MNKNATFVKKNTSRNEKSLNNSNQGSCIPSSSVVGRLFVVRYDGTMSATYSNIIPGSFILAKESIDIAYKTFMEASIKEGEIIKKEYGNR